METFEVIHIDVSTGRSDLDALLLIKQVLKRCCGDPVVLVDRGPWYNWPLDDLDLCESHRETWGNGLSSKRGPACRSTEPGSSTTGSPTIAPGNWSTAGSKPSQHFTMQSSIPDIFLYEALSS